MGSLGQVVVGFVLIKKKEEADGCFYNNNIIIIIGTYYSQGAGVELLGRCANGRTLKRGVVVGG